MFHTQLAYVPVRTSWSCLGWATVPRILLIEPLFHTDPVFFVHLGSVGNTDSNIRMNVISV